MQDVPTTVEVRGLTKHYGDKTAVDGASFDIVPGVVTGLLGPNGAGKSTLMQLMVGLTDGEGQTLFSGRPYRQLESPGRAVGALLDANCTHPKRSARNHLRMLAAGVGVSRARVEEVLAIVGLDTVGDKKAGEFSLGMRQRLGLASALLGEPHMLMLDEPANGLDPPGVAWLRQFLRSFAASGRPVLVSSHLLAEMQMLVDHVVVIARGRIVADDPMDTFLTRHTAASVRVRAAHRDPLLHALQRAGYTVEVSGDALYVAGTDSAGVGQTAFDAGIALTELSIEQASLEDVFLYLTGGQDEYAGRQVA